MREPLADAEGVDVATIVFEDGEVARFTSWCTVVIPLERVVPLEDSNIRRTVSVEFTNFEELNVREFVPLCIA